MNNSPSSCPIKTRVEKNILPQFIYKYMTIRSIKKILENNCLWFSSPKEFNDPFDCQITPNTDNTEEEILDYIRKKIGQPSLYEKSINYPNLVPLWKKAMNVSFPKIVNEKGVCCFSSNEKNLLMWSHYSDSHKGVCIKFDMLNDPRFFLQASKVNYREDYPIYNHLKNRNKLIDYILLSKSKDWSYENEIRIIKEKTGLFSFKKCSLIEITFGCKSKTSEIIEIKQLSKEKGFDLNFKKAERALLKYDLYIESI